MPIRIVLNGFFRSGTTLLWDWFRTAFPDASCYYEPLHPDLQALVQRERLDGKPHPDHRLRLWEEYNRLPAAARDALMRDHPGRIGRDWHDEGPLFLFLDHFHELPGDVILQPCRTSPFLAAIAARYDAATVHIVRHPLAVRNSMRRSASGSRLPILRLLRRVTWQGRAARGFDLQEIAGWFESREPGGSTHRLDGFSELLLYVWFHSNYHAAAGIEASQGTLIAYEELISDPQGVRARLERGLQRKIPSVPPLNRGLSGAVGDDARRDVLRVIEGLGLSDRFRELCAVIDSATGQRYLDAGKM